MLVEILLTWTVLVAGRGVRCDSLPSEAPGPDRAALAARKNHNNPLSSVLYLHFSLPPYLGFLKLLLPDCCESLGGSQRLSSLFVCSLDLPLVLLRPLQQLSNNRREYKLEKISKPLHTQGNLFRKMLQARKLLSFCCNFKAVLFLATCYCFAMVYLLFSYIKLNLPCVHTWLMSYTALRGPFNDSPYHTWSSAGLARPSAPSPGPLVADPQRVHLPPVALSLPEIDWSLIHEARQSHSFFLSLPIETVI